MSKHEIDWLNHQDILDWKEVAEEKQKFYCTFLGKSEWEVYGTADLGYLKLKIGYSLFGPPLNIPEENDIEKMYGIPNYESTIFNIFSEIKKHINNEVLYVSFIFLIVSIQNKYSEYPIIRVLKKRLDGKEFCIFIDTFGFSYENWELFINNNYMPKCIYCYPKNGFYAWNELGQVELGYSYSRGSFWNPSVMSTIGSFLNPLSQITLITDPFKNRYNPFAGESVVKGFTRRTRRCWIKVASVENCCSVYAIHSTHSVAAGIYDLGRLCPFLAKTLEKGTIRPDWLVVLNLMPEILRHNNLRIITYTHISQLFVNILFFCHTVVSYDTCKQILQETLDHTYEPSFSYRPMYSLNEVKDKIIKKRFLRIKRIDNKAHLHNEILMKNEHLDENGDIYFENLIQLLKLTSISNNSQVDKIRSYCFFLEVTNNCSNCNEKIKQGIKYMHDNEENTDIETLLQLYEALQSLKKLECLLKQCKREVFLEHVEDVLQGLLQTVREQKDNES